MTPNPFPLNIVPKVNSPELQAWLLQFGPDKYADALDFVKIVNALNYIYETLGGGEGIPSTYTQLIAIGEETIDGNDITIAAGTIGQIGVNIYTTAAPQTFTIPFTSADKLRTDIIVLNTSGVLVLVSGTEADVAFQPNTPPNTLLVTKIEVTEETFATIEPTYLSENIQQALNAADNPGAGNPFATMDDLPTGLPSQTGFSGRYLRTDGTNATWIVMPTANSLFAGFLSAANWVTFNGKQAALVSGTNIKTINGTTILGSGNLNVGTDAFALKAPVICAIIFNVDLSGQEILDGGAPTLNGFRYLLTAQTNPVENGIWIANDSGAWTRASDFAVGSTQYLSLIPALGLTDEGSMWLSTGPGIVGTDSMTMQRKGSFGQDANPTSGSLRNVQSNGIYNAIQSVLSSANSYTDGKVAGLLDLRGNYDASSNVFPSTGGSGTAGAIAKGDFWYVSVPGVLNGKAVNIGDSFYTLIDSPTSSDWEILQANLTYAPEDSANKSNSLADTASTVKFPVWSAVVGYIASLGYATVSAVTTALALKANSNDVESLLYSDVGSLGSHTGDTANTIVFTLNLPANTFITKDFFKKLFYLSKTGGDGCTARLYLGVNGTTADTLIATSLSGATQGWVISRERSHFNGSDLIRVNSTTNLQNDLVANNNASSSFTLTADLKLSVAFQLTNSADVATLIAYHIKRTRKI